MSDHRNAQDTVAGQKACARCGRMRRLEDFPTNTQTRSGLSSWCRTCHNAATRHWRNRAKARRSAQTTGEA